MGDFRMHMLLLTNYYPVPPSHIGGIFVTKRLENLKQHSIDFDVFALVHDKNTLLKLLLKLLNKSKVDPLEGVNFIESNGVKYSYIHAPIGVLRVLSARNNPLRLAAVHMKSLFGIIDSKRYELVHAHCIYPEGYIACLIKNKYDLPCVLTAHGFDIHTLPYTQPELKPIILETLQSADKVIFVSNALLKKAMELGYSGENAVVIPNGVSISSFSILDKTEARRSNGIYEPDMHYVGFVGNLFEVKRVDKFPEIFLNIKNKIPNVKFIIVGGGNLRDTIQEEFVTNNLDVIFTGRVYPELVPSWLNCMDCLVLPSRNEGWPCVVLEAQACGVPVVGSNAGGIAESVGEGGLIVEEGDHFEDRFAEAVCNILRNPLNSKQLRKRTLEYDWEKIVQKEIEIYQSLLR